MPYITPPPILPTDVGTDFLLDEIYEKVSDSKDDVSDDDQEVSKHDYNDDMLNSVEISMMGE